MAIANFQNALTYQGRFDKSRSYSIGDVVLKDGDTMLFNGEYWDPIGKKTDATYYDYDVLPMKCKCCGASLSLRSGVVKCDYCGTVYEKEEKK